MNAFDPVDLAMLAARVGAHVNVSISDCEELQAIAEMLHTEWMTIDENEWSAVFAYEVSGPLGDAIGAHMLATGDALDTMRDFARDTARALIADALA